MIQRILTYFERHSFGVCTYLGERLSISISKIRLFFIYASFLAVGFPIIFYILAAFVLDIRHYIKKVKNAIWDF
ncbi:MAG: PspC domain-containing protein [Sphingobacteriaceae bacterium]